MVQQEISTRPHRFSEYMITTLEKISLKRVGTLDSIPELLTFLKGNTHWSDNRTAYSLTKNIKASHASFIYSQDDKIIGFGRIVTDFDVAWLRDISTHRDYQKRGIGRAIVNALIESVPTANKIFACTSQKAQFYRNMGFELFDGSAMVLCRR